MQEIIQKPELAINNNSKVFSFTRNYKNSKVLVVVNLSNEAQAANFDQDFSKSASIYGNATFNNKILQLNPYQSSHYLLPIKNH